MQSLSHKLVMKRPQLLTMVYRKALRCLEHLIKLNICEFTPHSSKVHSKLNK